MLLHVRIGSLNGGLFQDVQKHVPPIFEPTLNKYLTPARTEHQTKIRKDSWGQRICLAPTARRSLAAWGSAPGIKHALSQALKGRLTSPVGVITPDMIGGVTRAFSACRDFLFYSQGVALWAKVRLRLRS